MASRIYDINICLHRNLSLRSNPSVFIDRDVVLVMVKSNALIKLTYLVLDQMNIIICAAFPLKDRLCVEN